MTETTGPQHQTVFVRGFVEAGGAARVPVAPGGPGRGRGAGGDGRVDDRAGRAGGGRPGRWGWWRRSAGGGAPRCTSSRCPVPGWRRDGAGSAWTPTSLLAAGAETEPTCPPALQGLSIGETSWPWTPGPVAVVRDRACGTVSATMSAATDGFPMRSSASRTQCWPRSGRRWRRSPVRRARCHGSRGRSGRTRRGWPATASSSRRRLAARRRSASGSGVRWPTTTCCSTQQAPVTVAHEVTMTVTVDLRRVRRRRNLVALDAALVALGEELELFVAASRRRRHVAVGAAVADRVDVRWSGCVRIRHEAGPVSCGRCASRWPRRRDGPGSSGVRWRSSRRGRRAGSTSRCIAPIG